MQTLFIILIILASILLAFFVLIQNPKGGGLAAGFAGSSNIMGVKRTGDFLEKMTWGLIIAIMICSLGLNVMSPTASTSTGGGRADQIEVSAPSSPILPLGGGEASSNATEAEASSSKTDTTK